MTVLEFNNNNNNLPVMCDLKLPEIIHLHSIPSVMRCKFKGKV